MLSFCSPLHNAVVMSNVKLVRRFSAVLSALGRSLDIFNKYGEVRSSTIRNDFINITIFIFSDSFAHRREEQ